MGRQESDKQVYRNGEPQIYCADCLHYGDSRTFPGDPKMDIIQCPRCSGERISALTVGKKREIDDEGSIPDPDRGVPYGL